MGREGLDDDFSGQVAATGATGDLSEQLKDAFAGPEVGHMESDVGIEDAHQGDVGKMQAFGNHLSADEEVDLLRLKGVKQITQGIFFAHGVGIDAGDAGSGKHFAEDVFDFLRAESLQDNGGIRTLRAFARDDGLMAANMADEAVVGAVIGEGQRTMRAGADVAACRALKRAGKAAAVEEEDGLFAAFEALVNGHTQGVGEKGIAAFLFARFELHIDDPDERHLAVVGAFGQAKEAVFFLLCVVE